MIDLIEYSDSKILDDCSSELDHRLASAVKTTNVVQHGEYCCQGNALASCSTITADYYTICVGPLCITFDFYEIWIDIHALTFVFFLVCIIKQVDNLCESLVNITVFPVFLYSVYLNALLWGFNGFCELVCDE